MIKNPTIFIQHILGSLDLIEYFMNNVTKAAFLNNEEKQSAVIRQIEIIGEAVKNLPQPFKEKYIEIPWEDIAGMRDKLMHHYFGVNLETVWQVVKKDLPVLKRKISSVKDSLEKDID